MSEIPIDDLSEVSIQTYHESAQQREARIHALADQITGSVRRFDTGATRDSDENKLDFEGFLHPDTVERFAEYMNRNRVQSDGQLRASDNWQKGIPRDAYMKSAFRHFMEWWGLHRLSLEQALTASDVEAMNDALCALWFNVQGYLFELIRER